MPKSPMLIRRASYAVRMSTAVLTTLAALALVVAVISVAVAARALKLAQRSSRDYQRIAVADSDVVDVLLDRISSIDMATKTVEELAELVQATRDDVAHTLRHVSVVRYDAFRDLAGRLSFSVALLNDAGDGMMLTSLRGRSETQFIAKAVMADDVESLTPEEREAVAYAMKGSA